MKKRELASLRTRNSKELKKLVEDKKLELIKVKSAVKVAKEKNLKKAKNLRHEIAQILTIVRENELVEKEGSTVR